jgi:ABC-type enterochelin transport system permease subunit
MAMCDLVHPELPKTYITLKTFFNLVIWPNEFQRFGQIFISSFDNLTKSLGVLVICHLDALELVAVYHSR